MTDKRTPLFLMANLGAEVSRLFSARERGERDLTAGALARAKNILKEIKKFPEMQARLLEVSLLEDAILDIATEHPRYKISPQCLKAYFVPFSLRLMSMP